MVQTVPHIVVQNRMRGTLGNPVRILTGDQSESKVICNRYTIDSGDDASLVPHNIWQPLRFISEESSPSQDATTLAIPLLGSGLYIFNMMTIIDVTDENRLFALQLGKDPDSPASGGPFNTATSTVMGMGTLSYTTLIERPTSLRVWTYGLSSATILNAGDLSYPVLEIIHFFD